MAIFSLLRAGKRFFSQLDWMEMGANMPEVCLDCLVSRFACSLAPKFARKRTIPTLAEAGCVVCSLGGLPVLQGQCSPTRSFF